MIQSSNFAKLKGGHTANRFQVRALAFIPSAIQNESRYSNYRRGNDSNKFIRNGHNNKVSVRERGGRERSGPSKPSYAALQMMKNKLEEGEERRRAVLVALLLCVGSGGPICERGACWPGFEERS